MSKRRCVHPYAKLQAFHDEPSCCYDCDGGPTHYFTCCNACGAILDGEIPNPIPRYWESAARAKAAELTGYPIEPDPPPFVGPPTLWQHTTAGLYMTMYDAWALDAMVEVTEASFGRALHAKTATAASYQGWRK